MRLFGNKITPYNLESFKYQELIEFLDINVDNLKEHRKLKLLNIDEYDDDSINKYFHKLENNIEIYSDYIRSFAYVLLKRKKYLECIKFIVNMYLKNNTYYLVLPIRDVLDEIENNDVELDAIQIPIIYDIYNKKIDSIKYDEYLDRFQDFVDSFDTYLPSEIYINNDGLTEEERYFLKNVCIPGVMDVYPEFKSTSNLKKERINILDILISESDSKNISYDTEKTQIFDELIFEQLNTDFDSSKIYVDITSLKNKREDTYKYLFELFQIAKNTNESKEDEYILLDEEDDSWIPVTDISSVVRKIYIQLLDDFVNNTDYGLDKYLSTDIRHGFFITNLRTGVEECKLLTEIGENDVYNDNLYWLEKYLIINDEFKAIINEYLKSFSTKFDNLLKEANNWLKTKNEEDINPGNGLFDFTPKRERLEALTEKLITSNDFNSFFNKLIEYMWQITDEATIKTKNQLNSVLKPNLLEAFDELENKLTTSKGSIPLEDLFFNIKKARYTVQKDLDRILNWFNCIKDDNKQLYGLKSVLKVSIDTYKRMKKEEDIFTNFNIVEEDIDLVHRELRDLVSALYTALINASSYKVNGTPINIQIIDESNYLRIKINNKLVMPSGITKNNYLEKLRENICSENTDLSILEGGTGLYKINNLLKNASNRFSFDIDIIDNDIFVAEIGVKK